MRRRNGFGCGMLLGVIAAACGDGGAATGGVGMVSLSLALGAGDPPAQLAPAVLATTDAQGSAIAVERATAFVRDIEFDLPEGRRCTDFADFDFQPPVRCDGADDDGGRGDDDGDKIEVRGPFAVDLVSGSAAPSLADLTLPAGRYRRADVRFEPADGAAPQTDLGRDTLRVQGRFTADAASAALELRLRFSEDARFESREGLELGESGASEALLWLDLSRWFAAVPLTECLADGDLAIEAGTLRVDEEAGCSEAENELKEAIKASGELR